MKNINQKISVYLILVFLIGLFIRILWLPKLTTYLGDQGIDFLNIYNLVEKKFSLLGPPSSIFGIYNGPLYYWLVAPFFKITGYNLITPAVVTAILNSLAILFIYKASFSLFNQRKAAFFSALTFALSPLMVYFSKISFNSFPSLFFLSVFYFFLIKSVKGKNFGVWLLAGTFAGLSSQLHYLNYLTVPTGIVIIFASVSNRKKDKLIHLIFFLTGFLIGNFPFFLFELRHNFFNLRTLLHSLQSSPLSLKTHPPRLHLLGLLNTINAAFPLSLLIPLWGYKQLKKERAKQWSKESILIIATPLILNLIAILLLTIISKDFNLQKHYFLLSFIPFFLLIGKMTANNNKLLLIITAVTLLVLNLQRDLTLLKSQTGYDMPKGWNIKRIEKVCQLIKADVLKDNLQGKYNVAWFIDGNTRAYALRFCLVKEGVSPLPVENFSSPKNLYILYNKSRGPIHQEKTWEVAVYRPFLIQTERKIFGPYSLFKLRKPKYQNGKPTK